MGTDSNYPPYCSFHLLSATAPLSGRIGLSSLNHFLFIAIIYMSNKNIHLGLRGSNEGIKGRKRTNTETKSETDRQIKPEKERTILPDANLTSPATS